MTPAFADAPEMAEAAASMLRPPERVSPSRFAELHIDLSRSESFKPGPWSNDIFPYLVPIMDAVELAINTGKTGLALMKSGQGGGSRSILNVMAWLRVYYPGNHLYLISKDEVAKEFGRDSFAHMMDTCEPLKEKALRGKAHGESILIKRFVDGKLVIHGGQSHLNFESIPYRVVAIDEVDSIQQTHATKGDLIENLKIRTGAQPGETLMIAFAHPTTKDYGVGRIYYELSDQRRGFVACIHCGAKFWLQREHVKVLPKGDETMEIAERDPERYVYVAPCCGCVITDGERYAMVAAGVEQVSTLPEEEAEKKDWIGVHFSHLYMNNKPLIGLARNWIAGINKPSVRRVTINKADGDCYEETIKETSAEDWRSCIVVPQREGDPYAYRLGQVPPGVSWLTAGQDSRQTELHWDVWGWGYVRSAAGVSELVRWLIDAGVVTREKTETINASDLEPLRGIIYDRAFLRTDGGHEYVTQGYHDYGWCPIAIWDFCRTIPGRAIPCQGENLDAVRAGRRPFSRWVAPPVWKIEGAEVTDSALRRSQVNTYLIKQQLFGDVSRHFTAEDGSAHGKIVLPQDVTDEWIDHHTSESLKKVKGKQRWVNKGPNHWLDCTVYASAAALQRAPLHGDRTRTEITEAEAADAVDAKRVKTRKDKWPIGRRR